MKAKGLLLEEVEAVKQLLAHSHLSKEVHKPLASADGAAEFRSTRPFTSPAALVAFLFHSSFMLLFESHWGDALQ